MEKLNKTIIITSKVLEVILVIGMVVILGTLIFSIFGTKVIEKGLQNGTMHVDVTVSGISYGVVDEAGNYYPSAFRFALVSAWFSVALMTMIIRNINLIFRTTQGKTWFSKGETPFQPDNIRMVREIGIFCIMIPVLELIISIVAAIILPNPLVDVSIDLPLILIGLVVLALSQYFAYGMELQNEVDGLV